MVTSVEETLGRGIARWVRFVAGRPRSTLIGASAFSVLALVLSGLHLGVVSDTDELFDPDLRFRQLRTQVEEALPLRADTILVVVDGPNQFVAGDAALELTARVRAEGDPFAAAFAPGLGEFFETHGFLYLEIDELEDLADRLAQAQPFLAALRRDPSVRGVFAQLEQAARNLDEQVEGGLDLSTVLEGMLQAVRDSERLDPHPQAFGDLVLGGVDSEGRVRRFVIVKPMLDRGDFVPAGAAIDRLREILAEYDYARRGIEVAITGDRALEAEEFSIVERQARFAGLASLLMVSGILWLALGSWRLILAAITTLLMGLFWTTGFAALAVGHMNLISVTFIVLFIGLAIDFAIHFTMWYQELRLGGVDHIGALDETARGVGGSLALCAVTTAVGFYAFVPTPYLGLAELGLISGTGMLLSLLASLTVLPAAISLGDPDAPLQVPVSRGLSLPSWPVRRPRTVVTAALVLAGAAGFLLPQLDFDANPLSVRDPSSESVIAFEELIADDAVNPWSIDVLVSDLIAAERLAARAETLPSVREARTLASYVPEAQADKLLIIENLAFMMEVPTGGEPEPPELADDLAGIRSFRLSLAGLEDAPGDTGLSEVAARLGRELDRFVDGLEGDGAAVEALRAALVDAILDQLDRLDRGLLAEEVELADLPPALRDRMVAADGAALVEIYPAEDLNDDEALARFVEEVRRIAEDATGTSVYMFEASNTIMRSLQQALATALALLTLVVFAWWRSVRDTSLVLAPLLLAAATTGAFAVLVGLSINFADVIVVPLLLGIGVDSGIHLVHRHRGGDATHGLLATSTPRAILWAALTTIASFGSLGFSTHLGIASLGQLLCLGVAVTLAANLVFLTALLTLTERSRTTR